MHEMSLPGLHGKTSPPPSYGFCQPSIPNPTILPVLVSFLLPWQITRGNLRKEGKKDVFVARSVGPQPTAGWLCCF